MAGSKPGCEISSRQFPGGLVPLRLPRQDQPVFFGPAHEHGFRMAIGLPKPQVGADFVERDGLQSRQQSIARPAPQSAVARSACRFDRSSRSWPKIRTLRAIRTAHGTRTAGDEQDQLHAMAQDFFPIPLRF